MTRRILLWAACATLGLGGLSSGCGDGDGCSSHARVACLGGFTYYFDSCGLQEEQVGTCPCGCDPGGVSCETDCCQVDCAGKECGSDGCGGSCAPGCGAGEACDAAGQCVACTPDCLGRECGPDGCGGSCAPGCQADESCDASGQCVACTPDCAGRECGPDGCGGSCAPGCGAGEACDVHGQCACAPDCGGKECGPDGCGGECGPGCGAGEACDGSGQCQSVACGQGLPTTVSGPFETGVAAVPLDTALVEVRHKRDVDPWEDGCIASVHLHLALGEGCRLRVLAGGRYLLGGGLEIQEVEFVADSFCPGFTDDEEGTYSGIAHLTVGEVVPGVSEVPGDNLAEACVRTSFTVRLQGELWRVGDGQPLPLALSEIAVAGEFVSLGDPGLSCPCAPSCAGRVCGDDGCGGSCGACQGEARCAASGQCLTAGPDTCWEGDSLRSKVSLQPGDLVVAEVMADSFAVTDVAGEWFEVSVTRAVDLNGLRWGRDAASAVLAVPEGDCLRVEAGRRLLVARETNPAVNGGLPAVDLDSSLSLANSNGALALVYAGQTLDAVGWVAATPGVASNLDERGEDPALNDGDFYWCPATQAYGLGDLGTPGAANTACDLATLVCTDNGTPRPKVAPEVGDLVITELMANPLQAPDAEGEWFEVRVNRAVDLNGLQAGRDALVDELVPEGACVRVAAGARVIFGKNADSAQNGGLPALTGLFTLSLINAGGSLWIGVPGTQLDAISYAATVEATAWSLDPDMETEALNDSPGNWCPATAAYNPTGDLGTPAAVNPQCD